MVLSATCPHLRETTRDVHVVMDVSDGLILTRYATPVSPPRVVRYFSIFVDLFSCFFLQLVLYQVLMTNQIYSGSN